MNHSEMLANPQHEKFAQLVAGGMDATDAYRKLNPDCKPKSQGESACRLSKKVKLRVKWLQSQSVTALTMTMQERREFFARVKRVKLHEMDFDKDGDLVQSIERIEGTEKKAGIEKFKLPGKRECVMDDARLAGELSDKPASVSVSVSVHVLAPERQKELQTRKLEAIRRRTVINGAS